MYIVRCLETVLFPRDILFYFSAYIVHRDSVQIGRQCYCVQFVGC